MVHYSILHVGFVGWAPQALKCAALSRTFLLVAVKPELHKACCKDNFQWVATRWVPPIWGGIEVKGKYQVFLFQSHNLGTRNLDQLP